MDGAHRAWATCGLSPCHWLHVALVSEWSIAYVAFLICHGHVGNFCCLSCFTTVIKRFLCPQTNTWSNIQQNPYFPLIFVDAVFLFSRYSKHTWLYCLASVFHSRSCTEFPRHIPGGVSNGRAPFTICKFLYNWQNERLPLLKNSNNAHGGLRTKE